MQKHARDKIEQFIGGALMSVFRMLEVCGEEAERAGDVSSELWMLLRPGDHFRNVSLVLYRHHVRELIERDKREERLDWGTTAEVVLGLRDASLAAPLTADGGLLYGHLFRRVMGDEAYQRCVCDENHPLPQEQWEGQLAELEYEAKRKVKTGRPKRA